MAVITDPGDVREDEQGERLAQSGTPGLPTSDKLSPAEQAEQDRIDAERGISNESEEQKQAIADAERDVSGDGSSSSSSGSDYVGRARQKSEDRNQNVTTSSSSRSSRRNKFSIRKNVRTFRIIILAIVLLLSVLFFILTIPFKILHIANTLFHHNFKNNEHTSTRAETRIIERLFRMHLNEGGGSRSATGRFIHDKLKNMRIDKMNKILAKDGIKMVFDEKVPTKLIGFEKDGQTFKDLKDASFWERRAAVGDLVKENLAPHRFLQHVLYTKAMRLHAGVSFIFWPKEKLRDIRERLISKVREGISGDKKLAATEARENRNQPDPKNTQGTADLTTADTQAGNDLDAAKAQAEEFDKTHDMTKAHEAGIKAFQSTAGRTFGMIGLAMLYCMLQEMVNKATHDGYMQRAFGLIREGNMLLTMADQMKTGQLNIEDYDKMMERFDGDPSADPDKEEKSKDFTQAAAWQRATGEPPSTAADGSHYRNYTPDLSQTANPEVDRAGLMGAIETFFNLPGTSIICKPLNGLLGWVLQGVELVVGIVTGGIEEVITNAAKGVFQVFAIQTIVPRLLDLLTNLSITGVEDPVGLINNADAGQSLSARDYARTLGDRTGTPAEVQKVAEAADADERAKAEAGGWTYRMFALDNYNSVLSKLVEHSPTSFAGAIAGIRSTIAAIPSNLGAVFFPSRFALAGDADGNPYKFRSYVTTDASIDEIAPEDAECFLTQPADQEPTFSNNIDVCPGAVTDGSKKTRLDALGDPTTYSPGQGEDSNKNDLMHCFVSSFRSPYDEDKDDICLDLGVLTQHGNDDPQNPGSHEIIDLIYHDHNQMDNMQWTHNFPIRNPHTDEITGHKQQTDFDIYRMYLKYVMLTRGQDGEAENTDPFPGGGSSTTQASTAPATTIDMAHLFDDSTSIACDPRTKSLGKADGYHNGQLVRINICSLSNLPAPYQEEANPGNANYVPGADGHAIVNSRVSTVWFNLVDALTKPNAVPNASAASSFRTMAHQTQLWNAHPDPTFVARPGTSNHQMGLAIDFTMNTSAATAPGNPTYDWLTAHAAAEYGISKYVAEAWHWSPTGN